MRYFAYVAEQSFKTGPTGERLFYRGGPWSKPYIIPDAETERRLFRKQVWMMPVLGGGLILGQPFLFVLKPGVINEPSWFVVYFAVVMAVFWAVGRLVFGSEIKQLRQTEARVKSADFYKYVAQTHSKRALTLGLLGSLTFVAGGVGIVLSGVNYAVGVVSIVFFGMAAIAWGYSLYLKRKSEKSARDQPTGT